LGWFNPHHTKDLFRKNSPSIMATFTWKPQILRITNTQETLALYLVCYICIWVLVRSQTQTIWKLCSRTYHLGPLHTRAQGPLTCDTQNKWLMVQVHFALDLGIMRDQRDSNEWIFYVTSYILREINILSYKGFPMFSPSTHLHGCHISLAIVVESIHILTCSGPHEVN